MMSGLDLQEELNKRGYVLPIIFLTGHGDVPASVKAFKGGAFDFIEKPPQEQALLDAIQKAIRKDFEGRIVLQSKQEALQILSSLTGKETKILKMIAKGEPNKAVAYEMGLSEKTIEYHRAKIMKNIGVSSIQELMKFAIESGMC
jgi:FixJ family two-component response regulator